MDYRTKDRETKEQDPKKRNIWTVVIHFAADSNIYQSWDFDEFLHL